MRNRGNSESQPHAVEQHEVHGLDGDVPQCGVVVNPSATRAVDDIASAYGAEVIRTPVGEINVAKRMKTLGALIGGERSGGVILPVAHLGRDAIAGSD
jgi:phosphomannomutase